MVVDPNDFNWKLENCLFLSFKTYQAHQNRPKFYNVLLTNPTKTFTFHILTSILFGTLKSQSTVHPSLQSREAFVVPGVHLGPRRQQHPADLRAASDRRLVQRGPPVAVLPGHGAGHRPQDVAHRAEAAIEGRHDDVVVASGGHGPPREGTGRAAEATTETQKIVEHVECFLFFLSQQRSVLMCIDVY